MVLDDIGYVQTRQSMNRGRNGLIMTSVTGYPRPMYTWTKDGEPLDMSTGRFTVSPTGSLGVIKVKDSDEGRYTLLVKQRDKDGEIIKYKTLVDVQVVLVTSKLDK